MGELGATIAVCAQCDKTLTPDDRITTGDKVFCRSCYATLRQELDGAVAAMSTNVNWPGAITGAVLGGIAGTLVWWGFTVLTNIAFGLIAVAIGFLVGHGTVRFSGGKRTTGLQVLAIGVSIVSFLVAVYLVNMSLVNKALAEQGSPNRVPFPPSNPEMFFRVVGAGFGIMDVVFLAIVVYEAWKIPRPIVLPPDAAV
ncbi:MAG TPA: hypothetical protein VJ826_15915 [Candidatus Polarisedimenticolaceae bacterium]|nr:hypothetical protein [Candidatus Polarisedimenticolaceae bacterium]